MWIFLVWTPKTWMKGNCREESTALLFTLTWVFGGTWYTPVMIALCPGISWPTSCRSQKTLKLRGTSPVGMASESSWILSYYWSMKVHSSGMMTYGSMGHLASVWAPFCMFFPRQYLGKFTGFSPFPKLSICSSWHSRHRAKMVFAFTLIDFEATTIHLTVTNLPI